MSTSGPINGVTKAGVFSSFASSGPYPGDAKPPLLDELYQLAGAVPALDLNFQKNKTLVDDISGSSLGVFGRLSNGAYLDSDGLIKTALSDVPRFEHANDGEVVGLLFEDRSTNYLLNSEDFSAASWTIDNGAAPLPATLLTNVATAPDGTATADKLVASGVQGLAANRVYQNAPFANPFTLSIFAKAGEADQILFRTGTGTVTTDYIVFSLVDGSIVTQSGTAPLNIYVKEYPNGWWRFGIASNSMSLFYFSVYGPNCQDGNGIYLWGANATYWAYNWRLMTSYVKTTSSTVTRATDTYYLSGANFASYFNNGGPGTKYMDFNINTAVVSFAVREKNGNFLTYQFWNGYATVVNSSIQAQFDFNGGAYGDREKWSLAYATNDFAGSRNGGTALTDSLGSLPSVAELRFEESVGIIRRYAYWPSRLANAKLEAMTTL